MLYGIFGGGESVASLLFWCVQEIAICKGSMPIKLFWVVWGGGFVCMEMAYNTLQSTPLIHQFSLPPVLSFKICLPPLSVVNLGLTFDFEYLLDMTV